MLAGHVKKNSGHVNSENHMPDGHVNQMLYVNPCNHVINSTHE